MTRAEKEGGIRHLPLPEGMTRMESEELRRSMSSCLLVDDEEEPNEQG